MNSDDEDWSNIELGGRDRYNTPWEQKERHNKGYDDHGYEEASVFRRIIAYLIDTIILGVIAFVILFVFLSNLPFDTAMGLVSYQNFGHQLMISSAVFLFVLCYFTVMESNYGKGATIGKRFMNIKVIDAWGKDINLIQSFLRNIVRWAWQIPCFGFVILILETLLVALKGVRFGDILVDSRVIVRDMYIGTREHEVYGDYQRY